MQENEWKRYEDIGNWDFSDIKYTTYQESNWNFYDEIKKHSTSSSLLLDLGTGGGEKALSFLPDIGMIIATDFSIEMIKTANENKKQFPDKKIKFVGTVYDQELLKKIRENAYGYFHGHEVGGTNPSLLEAMSSTDLNLLLGVGFNREVGLDAALYWSKQEGSLAKLIDKADQMSAEKIEEIGRKAKERIRAAYSWEYIVDQYETQNTQYRLKN